MRRFVVSMMSVIAMATLVVVPSASGRTGDDAFYSYRGATPLGGFAPGSVLKTRAINYHLLNIATPIVVTQVLYRSSDARGRPIANTTTVLRTANAVPGRVVVYGSVYDSLDPADSPSRAFAGQAPLVSRDRSGAPVPGGGLVANVESTQLSVLLAQGNTVVVPDIEGPNADFSAGPEYGRLTLDALRAVRDVPAAAIGERARIVMVGYSGGAIAATWAAALAPTYAPDVNRDLIGVAAGGVLVDPTRNLQYVSGSAQWAGITVMSLIGIARAYGIDFTPYASDRGRRLLSELRHASIIDVIGKYRGLRFTDLVEPRYSDPRSVQPFAQVADEMNLYLAAPPTVPFLLVQGAGGAQEGTEPGPPGIGPGDGVMIAGDVRALAKRYCSAGLPVRYDEYQRLSHSSAGSKFFSDALGWVSNRFAGQTPSSNCNSIRAGNKITEFAAHQASR